MKYPSVLYGTALSLLSIGLIIHHELESTSAITLVSNTASKSVSDCSSAQGTERIVCLAEAFKSTLSAEQITVLQRPYSKQDAVRWSNFPEFGSQPRRVGIRLGTLNETQLKAVKALMAAAMAQNVTNEGFNELEGNLAADEYLGNLTGKTDIFNPGNYFLAYLGTPSTTNQWELQFGGHHFAFANTYNGGKLIGVTPSFRGVEPIAPVTVHSHTYQALEQERQAFADLFKSLRDSQQDAAKLSTTFRDVLLGPGADGQFPTTKQGIKVGDLNANQKKLVLDAIKLYVNDIDPTTVAPVLATYTSELDNTYVAFAGSGTMSQQSDYVRIDGPHVWIEYSGQPSRDIPGTVHPHSVWRDRTSDYGGN